ncbi:hypothetical protein DMR_32450 [Solidesulfovibrio magneticus RS-1]|uniref:Uncharacterized protein n=1 Tax=Solidesulfovibrio magneticus (strain ATCC 700980 / DSM 13731 / RS-1) TaxID=573370 RepID=C4XJI6_SOLM1|nr:hypothetical protein DMR_32450 [Solidesulfovibrio magneticus RS-1]
MGIPNFGRVKAGLPQGGVENEPENEGVVRRDTMRGHRRIMFWGSFRVCLQEGTVLRWQGRRSHFAQLHWGDGRQGPATMSET